MNKAAVKRAIKKSVRHIPKHRRGVRGAKRLIALAARKATKR